MSIYSIQFIGQIQSQHSPLAHQYIFRRFMVLVKEPQYQISNLSSIGCIMFSKQISIDGRSDDLYNVWVITIKELIKCKKSHLRFIAENFNQLSHNNSPDIRMGRGTHPTKQNNNFTPSFICIFTWNYVNEVCKPLGIQPMRILLIYHC